MSLLVTDNTDCEREQDNGRLQERLCWGLSEFRCDGRSSAQRCEHRIPAAAPNLSRAHATARHARTVDRRAANNVDDRGGHEVAEHEEQRRDAKRSRAERSDAKRSRDVGTDWAMDD